MNLVVRLRFSRQITTNLIVRLSTFHSSLLRISKLNYEVLYIPTMKVHSTFFPGYREYDWLALVNHVATRLVCGLFMVCRAKYSIHPPPEVWHSQGELTKMSTCGKYMAVMWESGFNLQSLVDTKSAEPGHHRNMHFDNIFTKIWYQWPV